MNTELRRCLKLWEIVTYGVGLILGAGVYVLIGVAAGMTGNMLWLSFLLAATVASFSAMSYAELSAMYPRAGAEFNFAKEAFSSPALAWIVGLWAIMIGVVTASAVAIGFARYMGFFISSDSIAIAIVLLVLMSAINFWGIKESARFNIMATSIEVGGLLLVIIVGGFQLLTTLPGIDYFQLPETSTGMSFLPVVSAAALIFFAYMGFEDIANIAEEADQPEVVLPKAYLYALGISTVIYILVAIVSVSVVPSNALANSERPLSLVMETLIGDSASSLIAMIALFATANTVLITLIVCARMIYGMAKEGYLPRILSTVNKRTRTPQFTILLIAILAIAFLFLGGLEVLASVTDVGIFILFLFVNLSNIVLRYRKPNEPRPWRAPVNIGRLPVISVLGVVSCLGMLTTLNHPVELFDNEYPSALIGLLLFVSVIPFYWLTRYALEKTVRSNDSIRYH